MQKRTVFILLLSISVTAFSQTQKIRICIIDQKQLKQVEADYNSSNGDTTLMVNGSKKLFRQVYQNAGKEYAAGTSWYINNEPVILRGRKFVKYGLPRVLGVTEITRATEYKGVGIYVEAGFTGVPEVIYVPVRSGCEFQPYQREVSSD